MTGGVLPGLPIVGFSMLIFRFFLLLVYVPCELAVLLVCVIFAYAVLLVYVTSCLVCCLPLLFLRWALVCLLGFCPDVGLFISCFMFGMP